MTVTMHSSVTPEPMRCVIGHDFESVSIMVGHCFWYTVDGAVMCPDHIVMVQDAKEKSSLSESAMKKITVRADERRQREQAEAKIRNGSNAPGWVYYLRVR